MKIIKKLLFFSLFVCVLPSARAQGVFFVDKSLDDVLAQAKAEGKMVFVDCYSTHCPPCKKMLVQEFPKQEMGDYLNNGFVCAKYNLDNEPYKELAKRWDIHMYPTFVFLNNDGELLYRMVGFREADKFIAEAKKGISENRVGLMEKQYASGDRSQDFLLNYLKELERMGKGGESRNIAKEILEAPIQDLAINADKFEVFCRYVNNPYDEIFLNANGQRDELVAAYGDKAEQKFNKVWSEYLGHFAIIDGRDFKGYDWDKVNEYEMFMKKNGVKNHKEIVRQLKDSWKMYQNMEKK